MAGTAIRSALIFGARGGSVAGDTNVAALLAQGCRVVLVAADAQQAAALQRQQTSAEAQLRQEGGAGASSSAQQHGELTVMALGSRDELCKAEAVRSMLASATAANNAALPDLLVFNLGAFDDEGVLDMRQTSPEVRHRMMGLNGHLVGQEAAAMGVPRYLFAAPGDSGLGSEEAAPPSWWCDYCGPACPALWACCEGARAAPALAPPAPAPADSPLLGAVSASDPGAPWAPPTAAEGVPPEVAQGVALLAAADAAADAAEGGTSAHRVAPMLTTRSVAHAGVGLPGGSIHSANRVAGFSGVVPAASGAVPATAEAVADIEAALRRAEVADRDENDRE